MEKDSIIFVHGGPGMDSSYMKNWFKPLEEKYNLCFYDQDYSLSSNGYMTTLTLQLKNVVEKQKGQGQIYIFCHSWGSHVLLSALGEFRQLTSIIDKIVLSNPSATTWNKFNESGERLFSKIPNSIYEKIVSTSDGRKIMEMALPFYVMHSDKTPSMDFGYYDTVVYNNVSAEIENFDITQYSYLLKKIKSYSIYCEGDFEIVDGSKDIYANTQSIRFEQAGHFPFAERNKEFLELIDEIFST